MAKEFFMQQALTLAQKVNPSPNPRVGAVIVKNNKIIGEGYHRKAGEDHAEIVAIKKVKNKKLLQGATLYVTLEPCNHYGKTPPCTQAIIKAGIKEVIFATSDPHEKASGGERALQKSGIKIKKGICKKEAEELNKYFFYAQKNKRPYLIQKNAVTIDGKIWSKQQRRITGKTSMEDVHKLRNDVDAILVGASTVVKDNPFLTCRIKNGKDPLRIVLDSTLKVPLTAHIFKDNNILVITTKKADKKKLKKLKEKAIPYIIFEKKIHPEKLLTILHKKEIRSILLEGGSQMNTSFAHLANEFHFYMSPLIFGEKETIPLFSEKISSFLAIKVVKRLEEDIKIIARPICKSL